MTDEHYTHEKKAMVKLLKSFWLADKRYCDERCKLIPTIVEGNWAVRMAVGQKPVLLGQKVDQEYHKGPGYFELDINLSTSVIATRILGMVRPHKLLLPLSFRLILPSISSRFEAIRRIW